MILNTKQTRQYRADMAELARYRATGLTPEAIQAMLEPAPLPLNLWGEDISLGQGLLEDDGYDPALTAQENYQQERWNK